jgi:hypothetical protein
MFALEKLLITIERIERQSQEYLQQIADALEQIEIRTGAIEDELDRIGSEIAPAENLADLK